ncbi:MAG: hypothetical protein WCG01_02265 [bacterium]
MFKENRPPVARSTEAAKDTKLENTFEAEDLAFGYMAKLEESRALMDEMVENITVKDLSSETLQSLFDGVHREDVEEILAHAKDFKKIDGLAKELESREMSPEIIHKTLTAAKIALVEKSDENKTNNVNVEVFKDLLKIAETEDGDDFYDFIMQSIENKELASLSEHDQENTSSNAYREAENRAAGKSHRAFLNLEEYFELDQELGAYSDDEMKSIEKYAQAQYPDVRDTIRKLRQNKSTLAASKSSRNVDMLRSSEELGAMRPRLKQERIGKLNERFSRLAKKNLGLNLNVGMETEYEKSGNIVAKEFLPAYVNYKRELGNLWQMLHNGKIVETPYIKSIIEKILPVLKVQEGKSPTIVYLHGDHGTGKTALATHIARNYLTGKDENGKSKDPIIVSGSKYLEPDRFTETFKIENLTPEEHFKIIAKKFGEDVDLSSNESLTKTIAAMVGSEKEQREAVFMQVARQEYHNSLSEDQDDTESGFEAYFKKNEKKLRGETEELVNGQLASVYGNPVQGRFVLGAMYEAMRQGVPLIIDEANAIPPEVLIAFNDLLTKKIGETQKTQASIGEFQIKPGYCVIWTGNTGDRYTKARHNDTDPATYSRIIPVQVNYLPQSNQLNEAKTDIERLNLGHITDEFKDDEELQKIIDDSKSLAKNDQIFEVLLMKMMNQRLGARVLVKKDDRYSFFKDMYRLSVGARLIMDVFEGKAGNSGLRLDNLKPILGADVTPALIASSLSSANLTMRELMDQILGAYVDQGGSMDIEYYLWNYVKKYDQHPQAQAVIYATLNKAGFFSADGGWPDYMRVDSNQSQAVTDFKQMMNFDPLRDLGKYEGVAGEVDGKYKRIAQNGDYVSMLNTQGQYELSYFSSLEMTQLVFGYLPMRKKEEYEKIAGKMREGEDDTEAEIRGLEMVKQVKKIMELMVGLEYDSIKELDMVIDKIKEYEVKFDEAEKGAKLETYEEFFAFLEGYLHKRSMLSDEELAEAANMTPEQRAQNLINKLSNK